MTKQLRFTKEFEQEAVRLAQMGGRTRREVAEDLGIGLSTLTRWLSRHRDAAIAAPPRRDADEDMASELKRLRRENEILRQERDILKKATAFFVKDGVRPGAPLVRATRPNGEVSFHRSGEEGIPRISSLSSHGC